MGVSRRRFSHPLSCATVFLLAGCASVSVPAALVVSPTGFVYELGTPPVSTEFSQTAALFLSKDLLTLGLDRALLGVEAEPENPIHYLLAGIAHSRVAQHMEAHAMFTEAERIYPAYELHIAPEREAAWIELFNLGITAYAEGNVEGTIEAWEQAEVMWDLRPDASLNLATLFKDAGRWDDAIGAYQRAVEGLARTPVTRVLPQEERRAREHRRVLTEESLAQLFLLRERFAEAEPLLRRHLEGDPTNVRARRDLAAALYGLGQDEEAVAISARLLSETRLEATDLFSVGIAFYRANDFMAAAEAFERLTRLEPHSRDAWFNYTNSLFAAESWESLAPVGGRLTEVDPLGENAGLITARAHLELGDEQSAELWLDRTAAAPVYIEGLQLQVSGADTSIRGRVVGNAAEPGTPVRIRFTFYGADGALGTKPLTLAAPPAGVRASFDVSFPGQATAYRYELVSAAIP